MPDRRKKLGDFGEQAAAIYLTRQGYTFVTRKWRCAAGEIDLLMRDEATLVLVEVRTRRDGTPGTAEESVSRAKQIKLVTLAYSYLEAIGAAADTPWRIDVVALDVDRSGRVIRLNHIPNAVEEI